MLPLGWAILQILAAQGLPPTVAEPGDLEPDPGSELERLASLRGVVEPGPRLQVQLQPVAFASEGEAFAEVGGDAAGVEIANLKLRVSGEQGPFQYKVGVKDRDGAWSLSSTWLRVRPVDGLRVTVGNQKAPFLWSARVSRRRLAFVERSTQGGTWAPRDIGLVLDGELAGLRWFAGAQNGGDEMGADWLLCGRVEVSVLGSGFPLREGRADPGSEPGLGVGLSVADEGSIDDGRVLALDLAGTWGRLFLLAEVLDYGGGFQPGAVVSGAARKTGGMAGTSPVGLTAVWSLDERYDLGARLQLWDDESDTVSMVLGVQRTIAVDSLKWHLDWEHRESDDSGLEGDRVSLGLLMEL